ncbi:hypothetical protein LOK49_LG13G01012 [Camellia lanceoleosa]|uniref:Uncharacterized protein n=1 Tax=Camellia lanceoleosa TaxID=1840588 RepID=A0ACC0FIL1_9ERIC|nr:hypothetical protein LOK49_LG13G01012 [Camellia lanceoleosa]
MISTGREAFITLTLIWEFYRRLTRDGEYYSRAILADSKDGEVLSQYAKLVWELYHDQGRALSYFERAVQAAPEDSHVQGAYANFLWETEEDEDEDDAPNDLSALPSHFYKRTVASILPHWVYQLSGTECMLGLAQK